MTDASSPGPAASPPAVSPEAAPVTTAVTTPGATSRLGPTVMALAGALGIAFSAIFVRLSGTSPETAAFFRCAYAAPALFWLAAREGRPAGAAGAAGAGPAAARRLAWLAGLALAGDLVLWHHAIDAVGAGLATVLGNLQVVGVTLGTWLALGERPSTRALAAIPLALAGVVLISGVLEQGAYGADPARGGLLGIATAVAYSLYLILLRRVGQHGLGAAGSLARATAGSAAGIAAYGLLTGTLDLAFRWPAHGWLLALALGPQVVAWLLITVSLPRLPAAVGSLLLLVQPVGSVVLGRLILDEHPSLLQLGGVALILAGVVLASVKRPSAPRHPAAGR
ncbi:MAG: DMT family transporter [Thermaerobacter sp.]